MLVFEVFELKLSIFLDGAICERSRMKLFFFFYAKLAFLFRLLELRFVIFVDFLAPILISDLHKLPKYAF